MTAPDRSIEDAALIAFVRAERDGAANCAKAFGKGAYSERADMFTALLSRLEGRGSGTEQALRTALAELVACCTNDVGAISPEPTDRRVWLHCMMEARAALASSPASVATGAAADGQELYAALRGLLADLDDNWGDNVRDGQYECVLMEDAIDAALTAMRHAMSPAPLPDAAPAFVPEAQRVRCVDSPTDRHGYECVLCGHRMPDAAPVADFKVLASAMRKMLPPELLADVIAHLDPLTPFVAFLAPSSSPAAKEKP